MLSTVLLKFMFKWESCILSGNPTLFSKCLPGNSNQKKKNLTLSLALYPLRLEPVTWHQPGCSGEWNWGQLMNSWWPLRSLLRLRYDTCTSIKGRVITQRSLEVLWAFKGRNYLFSLHCHVGNGIWTVSLDGQIESKRACHGQNGIHITREVRM